MIHQPNPETVFLIQRLIYYSVNLRFSRHFLAHGLLCIVFVSICVYFVCYLFLSLNFLTDNSVGLIKKKTGTTEK